MIYTVAEVSELVNLSKASIYTRLKTKDFKEHITKKQGVTYIDDIGFQLIQGTLKDSIEDNFKNYKDTINGLKDKDMDITIDDEVATDTDYISYLKEDINYFKDQMKEKDIQIHELNDRLATEQELNKNNQVLQLRQPQDIKALESHFQELDTRLEEVKENMLLRKEHHDKPKGFLSKIFNRK